MLKRRSIKLKLAGGLLAIALTIPAHAGALCVIPKEVEASACQVSAYLDGDNHSQLSDCIDSLLNEKRDAEALVAANNGLSIYSNNARLVRQRGRAWFSKREYDCALADFTAAINIAPEDHRGYFLRGLAYWFKDLPSLAMPEFNRAIELNPSFSHAYLARALTYEQLRDWERAQIDAKRYLGEFPDDPTANRVLRRVEERIERRKGWGCALDHTPCG
jgi:tetratricopeptide (TPR) repeat protein